MARQVILVNFALGFVWTDDGHRLPITNWFDEDNRPTDDFRDAVSFVAGAGDQWYPGLIADWQNVTIN